VDMVGQDHEQAQKVSRSGIVAIREDLPAMVVAYLLGSPCSPLAGAGSGLLIVPWFSTYFRW
jgi:hypothetical protein